MKQPFKSQQAIAFIVDLCDKCLMFVQEYSERDISIRPRLKTFTDCGAESKLCVLVCHHNLQQSKIYCEENPFLYPKNAFQIYASRNANMKSKSTGDMIASGYIQSCSPRDENRLLRTLCGKKACRSRYPRCYVINKTSANEEPQINELLVFHAYGPLSYR